MTDIDGIDYKNYLMKSSNDYSGELYKVEKLYQSFKKRLLSELSTEFYKQVRDMQKTDSE